MKFIAILFVALCLISSIYSGRIRKIKNTDAPIEYVKSTLQGFLSGIVGERGSEINDCLPTSIQGVYLAQDLEEKEAEGNENKGLLNFIWSKLKYILDLACKFKDGIMKLFGMRRRMRRNNRRLFLSKSERKRVMGWVEDVLHFAQEKFSSFVNWLGNIWKNLESWAAEKWAELKTWTAQAWSTLMTTVAGAIEKAKAFKDRIVSWLINKILPLLSVIFKCARLLLTLLSKLFGIIKAILQVVAGNVIKIADMIINVICSYQTIIDV